PPLEAVLRAVCLSRDLRSRLEGGHVPRDDGRPLHRRGRPEPPLRARPLGALPRRRGSVGVARPRGRGARASTRAARLVVARGGTARRAAAPVAPDLRARTSPRRPAVPARRAAAWRGAPACRACA